MKNEILIKGIAATLTITLLGFAGNSFAQNLGKKAKVANGLYQIVFSEKSNSLYVAGVGRRGSDEKAKIFKLDPKTLDVTGTIDVSEAPAYGLGLNDKTQTLYSSNTRNNSVSAIDLKTNKVIATITNGKDKSHTREVIVDEGTNKVYVSNMTDVWVIDGATNKFSHLIEGVGEGVTGLSLNKEKQLLYITNMGTDTVTVYDLKASKVSATLPSGGKAPINILHDSKGKRLLVVNQGSGDLTVLNEAGKLLQTIPTGAGALSLNFNASKNLIYVANRTAGTTSIIDGKTYQVISSLKTGTYPQTIAIDQKSGVVFVTNKAAAQRRAAEGTAPQAPVDDPNGDIITIIQPK